MATTSASSVLKSDLFDIIEQRSEAATLYILDGGKHAFRHRYNVSCWCVCAVLSLWLFMFVTRAMMP